MSPHSKLFLVPCTSDRAKHKLETSVLSSIYPEEYGLSKDLPDELCVWGTTTGNVGTWDAVNQGDYLLFYTGDGIYQYAARVTKTLEKNGVDAALWNDDHKPRGPTSSEPYLILLEAPHEVKLTVAQFAEQSGYEAGQPQEFERLGDERTAQLVSEFGSVSNFIQQQIDSESKGKTAEPLTESRPIGKDTYDTIARQLSTMKQVVLYGPPGTGKTHQALAFTESWLISENDEPNTTQYQMVTFHPSFSYEDFVEGLSVTTSRGSVKYTIEPGVFKRFAKEATAEAKRAANVGETPEKFVFIIDEMNRANLSQVLGEMITILEADKRGQSISLARSTEDTDGFSLPSNLYVIGTMNTSDQSVALIDAAIRRRFRFVHCGPDYQYLRGKYGFESSSWDAVKSVLTDDETATPDESDETADAETVQTETKAFPAAAIAALAELNDRIRQSTDLVRGKQIGHAYLIAPSGGPYDDQGFVDAWRYEILPLLEEYYFGDFDRLKREILQGDGDELLTNAQSEFGDFGRDQLLTTLRTLATAWFDE